MYNNSTEEELKLLIRSNRSEQFRFVVVQYNHYDLVRKAKQELKNAYPTRKTNSFSLEEAESGSFISSIIDCKEGFIFLEKFELLFTEKFQSLAIGFNQRRDLFSNYPLQIIFFIFEGSDNLKQFQQTLPDVFSITNPFIELRQEIEVLNSENIVKAEIDFINIKEADQEIERIKKRLHSLENTIKNENLLRNLKIQLAEAYRFVGQYEISKDILTKVLSELSNKKGKEVESSINNVYNNLGIVHRSLGEVEEAKSLLKRAVTWAEENYGLEHSNTAVSYSNLAILLLDSGEFEKAKELVQKALISDIKNFGIEHVSVAINYSILAIIFHKLGAFKEALELIQKAIKIDEKIYGTEHPVTATHYVTLVSILNNLGESKKAIGLAQEIFSIFSRSLGVKHPKTITVKKNLDYLISNLTDTPPPEV